MISIVMNCHNGLEYLDEAIVSVLNQTDSDWEIVFWDNASTEPIKDAVVKYGDPRIRYFRSDDFAPLGLARNQALEHVEGEYIAFLDVDDYWMPEKLEKQRRVFEQDARAGIVYTDANILYGGKVIKRVMKGTSAPEGMVFGQLLAAYFLVNSSVIMRRQALEGLKRWFDPRYELVTDYDLFLRIAADWSVRCVNEVLTAWRWHTTSTTMRKRRLISIEKRMLLKTFHSELPALMNAHRQEVDRVRGKIMISTALSHYYAGNSKRARRILSKSRKASLKGIFVYGATFFPVRLVDVAYRNLKRNPLV